MLWLMINAHCPHCLTSSQEPLRPSKRVELCPLDVHFDIAWLITGADLVQRFTFNFGFPLDSDLRCFPPSGGEADFPPFLAGTDHASRQPLAHVCRKSADEPCKPGEIGWIGFQRENTSKTGASPKKRPKGVTIVGATIHENFSWSERDDIWRKILFLTAGGRKPAEVLQQSPPQLPDIFAAGHVVRKKIEDSPNLLLLLKYSAWPVCHKMWRAVVGVLPKERPIRNNPRAAEIKQSSA